MATTMYPSFGEEFDDDQQNHLQERSSRASRNSMGVKEEFLLGTRLEDVEAENEEEGKKPQDNRTLAFVFVSMVVVGLGNKVFNKLMTIPMYNYPNFLNLLTSFVYIPVCFSYIIPMAKYGYIPPEQFEVPKKSFAIMGALDALASIMQIFGATYLPGPLIILLLQAAIPVSMVISKYLLNATYNTYQYIGAFIVAGGIMIVLAPTLNGGGSIIWAIVLILSTVPMTLSSVYKEIALGDTDLDAVRVILSPPINSLISNYNSNFIDLFERLGGSFPIWLFFNHCYSIRPGL